MKERGQSRRVSFWLRLYVVAGCHRSRAWGRQVSNHSGTREATKREIIGLGSGFRQQTHGILAMVCLGQLQGLVLSGLFDAEASKRLAKDRRSWIVPGAGPVGGFSLDDVEGKICLLICKACQSSICSHYHAHYCLARPWGVQQLSPSCAVDSAEREATPAASIIGWSSWSLPGEGCQITRKMLSGPIRP